MCKPVQETTFTLDQRSQFPFTLRLPATPPSVCDCPSTPYELRIKSRIKVVHPFNDPVPALRITIDGVGWEVFGTTAADAMTCPADNFYPKTCLVYADAYSNIYVFPQDNKPANAPARNLTVELLDSGASSGTCP